MSKKCLLCSHSDLLKFLLPLYSLFFRCSVVFFHLTAGSTVSPLFSRNRLHCHTHSLHALSLIDSNQYILWSTPKTVAHSRVPWVRQTRGLNVHRHFHLGYAPTSRCPSHKGKKSRSKSRPKRIYSPRVTH